MQSSGIIIYEAQICGLWDPDHCDPVGGTNAIGSPIKIQIDESKFMHRK